MSTKTLKEVRKSLITDLDIKKIQLFLTSLTSGKMLLFIIFKVFYIYS